MRSARANKAKLLCLSQSLLKADKAKLIARDKLYIQAIDELTIVSTSILQKYKQIFEQVLQAAGKPKTPAQQREQQEFVNIIRSIKYSHLRDPGYDIIMHHLRLYDECLALVERHKPTTTIQKNQQQQQQQQQPQQQQQQRNTNKLSKLLAEKGIGKVNIAYKDFLRKALERLNQTVLTYLNTLPASELQKEAQIMQWLEKSKNEMREERKIGILMEFFTTYESGLIESHY